MKKIILHGVLNEADFMKGEKPEYLFLPKPINLDSDIGRWKIKEYPVDDNNLKWKVVWEGEELCNRVYYYAISKKNYWKNILTIFNKLSHFESESENQNDIKHLIKDAKKQIYKWEKTVAMIEKQYKI